MTEDFLHYIWKFKRFNNFNFKSVTGESIHIIESGIHNHNSGPDFFNAKVRIDDQVWAGNVEVHIKSSDWYKHGHECDTAYGNVILHVVWTYDKLVSRPDGSELVTVELKNYVNPLLIESYSELIASKSWINCGNSFGAVSDLVLYNWIERLFIERLEHKSKYIQELLVSTQNNWDAVLFILLCRYFGSFVNHDSFESCARSIGFSVVNKSRHHLNDLEALFYGQLNMLQPNKVDNYHDELRNNYKHLKRKFKLSTQGILPIKMSRLRPANFPTIRLGQFAALYHEQCHLFSKLIKANSRHELHDLFEIKASAYWNTHYTFGKPSSMKEKVVSTAFKDLLIINVVIPLKYVYMKFTSRLNADELINLVAALPSEVNSTVRQFQRLKVIPSTGLFSQGLLQLKTEYCDKNACLSCSIAHDIML